MVYMVCFTSTRKTINPAGDPNSKIHHIEKYDPKSNMRSQRFIVEVVAAYHVKRCYCVGTTLLHPFTSPIPRPREYWGAEGRKPARGAAVVIAMP